jgi:hypothetical protein
VADKARGKAKAAAAAQRRRRNITIGISGGVVAVAVVVAVLAISLSGGSSKPPGLTHLAYARLWTRTVIGTPRTTVLANWPKPYQTYPDGFKNQCFEWWDKPLSLYNLCFRRGVLVTKSIA